MLIDIEIVGISDLKNDDFIKTNIKDYSKTVISEEEVYIIFSYPLSSSIKFHFKNKGGFSKLDLLRCVYIGYKRIYEKPNFYGVYGHDIDNLLLEEVKYYSKNNTIILSVGS